MDTAKPRKWIGVYTTSDSCYASTRDQIEDSVIRASRASWHPNRRMHDRNKKPHGVIRHTLLCEIRHGHAHLPESFHYHFWILTNEVPAFVRFEGPLFLMGPAWRIELISPRLSLPGDNQIKPK